MFHVYKKLQNLLRYRKLRVLYDKLQCNRNICFDDFFFSFYKN